MENKKYDLEKAKEDCRRHEDALEEAQSCMCGHCHECGFDPSEMKAALDEVERLRSDWRQEHATAETWKEDFKKMQKRLTDSELLRQDALKAAGVKETSLVYLQLEAIQKERDAWKAKAIACFVVATCNQRNEMENEFWNTDSPRWKRHELTLERAAEEIADSIKSHLSEEYGEKQEAINIAARELEEEMRNV